MNSENMKLLLKIHELKGMIESLSDLADYDETFDNPMVLKLGNKMKEVMDEVEKMSA